LPDPLICKDGKKVTAQKMWWRKCRPEIVEDFDREIYGRVPPNAPTVDWQTVSQMADTIGGVPVITKKLIGHVDNTAYPYIIVDMQLTLIMPVHTAGPVPVILELGYVFPPGMRRPRVGGGRAAGTGGGESAAAGAGGNVAAGARGGAAASGAGGAIAGGEEQALARGWAWGASRVMDYLGTDKAVDARRVGIEGHSRFGKAALVAMAYDPRWAVGFISSSGQGGAKLSRRNAGEIIENLAGSGEYHWMAGNFLKYAGPLHWNDLPVDAHELIALCAPRPVFISAGLNGDAWVDARGMWMAAVAAGPVYRLLGVKGVEGAAFPAAGTALTSGEIAFRQHSGGHTPGPNWPFFLDYASRYFGR